MKWISVSGTFMCVKNVIQWNGLKSNRWSDKTFLKQFQLWPFPSLNTNKNKEQKRQVNLYNVACDLSEWYCFSHAGVLPFLFIFFSYFLFWCFATSKTKSGRSTCAMFHLYAVLFTYLCVKLLFIGSIFSFLLHFDSIGFYTAIPWRPLFFQEYFRTHFFIPF